VLVNGFRCRINVSSSKSVSLKGLKGPTHRNYDSNKTIPKNQDAKFSTSITANNNIISKLNQVFTHYFRSQKKVRTCEVLGPAHFRSLHDHDIKSMGL
jgi:hypothetical protein